MLTFDEAIAKIDPKKQKARFQRQRRLEERTHLKIYPTIKQVAHRVIVEAQAPGGVTLNEDDEVSGKGLTDWYVETYCKLNGLRRTK
jgi:tRNA1(Val) A37 N6-methylase TrmN6